MVALLEKLRSITPTGRRLAAAEARTEQLQSKIRTTYKQKYHSLLARYDAAQNTVDNSNHWANADALSAEAAADPMVRSRLRTRSRYECQENNSYGKGIILKHANHLVGRVPHLQVSSGNQRLNDLIEKEFAKWANVVQLGRKLRTMAKSKTVDGEAFAKLVTNESVAHAVKLDLRLIEADQIETPMLTGTEPNYISGVKYDAQGLNPLYYDLLPAHPGSIHTLNGRTNYLQPIPVPAREMLHWYREDRPNQKRGLPETAAALPLFSQLRRFTLATIAAAETAAEIAGVLKTTASEVETEDIDPLEAIDLEMRSLLTLPQGWDMNQVKSEHPSTTFDMFESAILRQIAQPLVMPYNVAAGDSSKHNFSSGRLDHKMYESAIDIERYDLGCGPLLQLFASWYLEFKLWAKVSGLWAGEMPPLDLLEVAWFFDAIQHAADPSKEATGELTRLGMGATSLPELYAHRGLDWRRELRRGAEALGVTLEEYQALLRKKLFGGSSADEPPTDEPEEETEETAEEDETDEETDEETDDSESEAENQPAEAS